MSRRPSIETGFRHPLALWLVWDDGGPARGLDDPDPIRPLAEALHRMFCAPWVDSGAPVDAMASTILADLPAVEAEIPVFFWSSPTVGADALERAIDIHAAARVVVCFIVTDPMWTRRTVWQAIAERIYARNAPGRFTVAMAGAARTHEVFRQSSTKARLRLDPEAGYTGLYLDLLGVLCRQFYDDALPTIFLSHTKSDAAATTRQIKGYLDAVGGVAAWQDVSDIAPAQDIRERIEATIPQAFYLAVLSPNYLHRPWTRWETSLARRHNRPMAVIDALKLTVRRFPPELANAPVLRWPPPKGSNRRGQVVALVLTELLRHCVHDARVGMLGRATGVDNLGATVLPPGPAPKTDTRQIMVYADPPLTADELRYQGRGSDIEYVTAAQYSATAGWPGWSSTRSRRAALAVGLSVSLPGDAHILGLGQSQLIDLSVRLARTLMCLDARLVYGGDLRPGGLTRHLSRIAGEYAPGRYLPDLFHNFESWPFWLRWRDDSEAVRQREQVMTQTDIPAPDVVPEDAREKFPDLDSSVEAPGPSGVVDGRLWTAAALTEMRARLTAACHARIAVGGRAAGALGRMPGVVEEVSMALRVGQPVYLAAAFGGATRALYDCLNGENPVELTLAHQIKAAPIYEEVHARLEGSAAVDWPGLRDELKDRGLAELSQHNGLSIDENRSLARATTAAEIVYWVSRGMGRVFGPAGRADVADLRQELSALRDELARLRGGPDGP